jgi:hypothetical protein
MADGGLKISEISGNKARNADRDRALRPALILASLSEASEVRPPEAPWRGAARISGPGVADIPRDGVLPFADGAFAQRLAAKDGTPPFDDSSIGGIRIYG